MVDLEKSNIQFAVRTRKMKKIIDFRNKFLVTKCESKFSRISLKDMTKASTGKYKILCIIKRILNYMDYIYVGCKKCKKFREGFKKIFDIYHFGS